MERISVIIPARDAAATLGVALDALGREPGEPEIVVVDNGSRDDTARVAEAAGVTVVRRARGDGPGAARNAGIAAAGGEHLALLDADCMPAPGWLAAGGAALAAGAELVQGRVAPDPAATPGPFDRTLYVLGASPLFESANLFLTRDLFVRVGGFPGGLERPDREAPFGEDTLFGWRARRLGARAAFCPEALVYHAVTRRGVLGPARERARLARFPALVAAVPELRDELLFRRMFLSRRTAALDLALAGALVGVAGRRPAALLAAVPYVYQLGRRAAPWGGRLAAKAALGDLAADLAGAVALARGSAATRTVVL